MQRSSFTATLYLHIRNCLSVNLLDCTLLVHFEYFCLWENHCRIPHCASVKIGLWSTASFLCWDDNQKKACIPSNGWERRKISKLYFQSRKLAPKKALYWTFLSQANQLCLRSVASVGKRKALQSDNRKGVQGRIMMIKSCGHFDSWESVINLPFFLLFLSASNWTFGFYDTKMQLSQTTQI